MVDNIRTSGGPQLTRQTFDQDVAAVVGAGEKIVQVLFEANNLWIVGVVDPAVVPQHETLLRNLSQDKDLQKQADKFDALLKQLPRARMPGVALFAVGNPLRGLYRPGELIEKNATEALATQADVRNDAPIKP